MPGTFVKIYQSIIKSTIWLQDSDTRIVWITMLADADVTGHVWGSVPGLARLAGVKLEQCEKALKILSEPDIHSSSSEQEGRRIKAVEGGWFLINHGKYRAFRTPKQVVNAARQKRFYHRKREDRQPNASNAQSEIQREKKSTSTDLSSVPAARPNPFVQGRRTDLEREALKLTGELSALTGEDPMELFAQAASYDGAKRQKVNPASLSDDRLANTVIDLRRNLQAERLERAKNDRKRV